MGQTENGVIQSIHSSVKVPFKCHRTTTTTYMEQQQNRKEQTSALQQQPVVDSGTHHVVHNKTQQVVHNSSRHTVVQLWIRRRHNQTQSNVLNTNAILNHWRGFSSLQTKV
jgi:hypothetical protein